MENNTNQGRLRLELTDNLAHGVMFSALCGTKGKSKGTAGTSHTCLNDAYLWSQQASAHYDHLWIDSWQLALYGIQPGDIVYGIASLKFYERANATQAIGLDQVYILHRENARGSSPASRAAASLPTQITLCSKAHLPLCRHLAHLLPNQQGKPGFEQLIACSLGMIMRQLGTATRPATMAQRATYIQNGELMEQFADLPGLFFGSTLAGYYLPAHGPRVFDQITERNRRELEIVRVKKIPRQQLKYIEQQIIEALCSARDLVLSAQAFSPSLIDQLMEESAPDTQGLSASAAGRESTSETPFGQSKLAASLGKIFAGENGES